MLSTTSPARRARRSNPPLDPGRHRAAFARAITLDEFGSKNGKALDQADFLDRPPGELLRPSAGVSPP